MKNFLVGRRGEVTGRDEQAMRDLFFLDHATVDDLAIMDFPGTSRKRTLNRLNELKAKGRLVNETLTVSTDAGPTLLNFFSLAKEMRAALARTLESEGLPPEKLHARMEPTSKNLEGESLNPLSILRAEHAAKVSRLYVLLKGGLEKELGAAGRGWIWRNERRAYRPYDRATGRRYYRPDAELLLYPPLPFDAPLETMPQPVHLFIEVQTARSRATSTEIAQKVADHKLATTLPSFPSRDRRFLVFAGETQAHLRAATTTADRYDVPLIAGDLKSSAAQILDLARELVATPVSASQNLYARDYEAPRPAAPHVPVNGPGAGVTPGFDAATPKFGPSPTTR